MSNSGVLVYCELTDGKLAPISFEMLGAGSKLASALGQELSGVVIGSSIENAAREAVAYGADKVYMIDDPQLEEYTSDLCVYITEKVIEQVNPSIVLMGQSSIGRDLAPRLAFRLDTAATLDCVALDIDEKSGRLLQTKPVYGGNAHVIQTCESDPQIVTIRSKAFEAPERDENRQGECIALNVDLDGATVRTKLIERKIEASTGIKLEDAKVIVTGGRGIGGSDGFEQLKELADLLGGTVGASRPACDNEWVSENLQVGLTGKIVGPEVYIAVGVSGASQHLSGCSMAKTIIAINKDPEANIFNVAHYGIVEDWKEALPAFTAKIKEFSTT